MPDTHGFEMVVEIGLGIIRRRVKTVLENSGRWGKGIIAAGAGSGPPVASCGEIRIQAGEFGLEMLPPDNNVLMTFGVCIRVAVLSSDTTLAGDAAVFDMAAKVVAKAPVGILPGSAGGVGVLLGEIPRRAVIAILSRGDLETPIRLQMIHAHVCTRWRDLTMACAVTVRGIDYGFFTADAFLETFNDPDCERYGISVTAQTPDHVKISIPMHLRLSGITDAFGMPLLSPMGVQTRISYIVPVICTAGCTTIKLSSAVVVLEPLDSPVPSGEDPPDSTPPITGAPWDGEAENFLRNRQAGWRAGLDLERILKRHILGYGTDLATDIGDFSIMVPTVEDIETFIGEQVHGALLRRRSIELWRPGAVAGRDVHLRVHAGGLGIAINPLPGADENRLPVFRQASRGVAVSLEGAVMDRILGEALERPAARGGFGAIPREFADMGGYCCTVSALNWTLRNSAIRFTGDVLVYNVFWGATADCSFWVEIGLRWTDPDAGGPQRLEPYLIDQEVDFSWWPGFTAVLGELVEELFEVVRQAMPAVMERIAWGLGGVLMPHASYGGAQVLIPGTVLPMMDGKVEINSGGLLVTGDTLGESVPYDLRTFMGGDKLPPVMATLPFSSSPENDDSRGGNENPIFFSEPTCSGDG
jgi:hypothetical protein